MSQHCESRYQCERIKRYAFATFSIDETRRSTKSVARSRSFLRSRVSDRKFTKEIYKDKSSHSRRRLFHNRCNRQSAVCLPLLKHCIIIAIRAYLRAEGRIFRMANASTRVAHVSAGDAFAKQTCTHVLYVHVTYKSLCTFEKSSSEHSNNNLSRISRIRDCDRALIRRTISGRSRSEIILSNFV